MPYYVNDIESCHLDLDNGNGVWVAPLALAQKLRRAAPADDHLNGGGSRVFHHCGDGLIQDVYGQDVVLVLGNGLVKSLDQAFIGRGEKNARGWIGHGDLLCVALLHVASI